MGVSSVWGYGTFCYAFDRTLKVWDLEIGEVTATLHGDGSAECCVFATNNLILAGDAAGRVHFLALEE